MTIAHRSLIAITLAAALAGCGKDNEPTVPFPEVPEPLVPAPAEEITVQIGDTAVKAMKESLVITSNTEDDKIGYVEAFKGIKFAEAERFAHSDVIELSDLENEDGVVEAIKFGDVCPQTKKTEIAQSEDCLNLNIWRPVDVEKDAELPVYVFIHGGNFEFGAGSNALVQGDTVVAQGASEGNPFIYVSFNYRLGLLGSRWVEEDKGGNFGVGDQKRALEWVNKNIAMFGGNPQDVTLMGQGTGAMSVGILQATDSKENIVSDSRYFQKAIQQSNNYGFQYKSYDTAKSSIDAICEATGTSKTETGDNTLRSILKLVALIAPDDYKDVINKVVELLPKETDKEVCVDNYLDIQKTLPLKEILDAQAYDLASPLTKTIGWLSDSIMGINPFNSGDTPTANFLPFAPYTEYKSRFKTGHHFITQPALHEFSVPTLIGNNAKDAQTMSMLPTLTFLIGSLIPSDLSDGELEDLVIWLQDKENQKSIIDQISNMSEEDIINQLEKFETSESGLTAYGVVTKLFFGLGNSDMTNNILSLTDYMPDPESELSGGLTNRGKFNTLMNDMMYQGPARNQAIKAVDNVDAPATLYHFAFSPSFNVWTHNTKENGKTDIGDLLKSINCITGSCSGSELPFIFNKPYKMDGTEVSPLSKDRELMNEMSRLWFSERLFSEEYQYNKQNDNMLFIDSSGSFSHELGWDDNHNNSADSWVDGRLQMLNDLGLMLNYMPDYEIPQQ